MRRLTNNFAARLVLLGLVAVGISGCDPFKENRAIQAEQTRIACLDKFCEGDVEPKRDMATEVAIKLNGQWYVGPKEYFSGYDARAGFEWWEHKPISAAMKRPPEMQALAVDGKGYDFSIEIFLTTKPATYVGKSMYQALLDEERQGNLIEKRNLKPGLDAWRIKSLGSEATWFVATHLKDPSGDPPTISCRGVGTDNSRCSGGFIWIKPDVGASLRFRATHGPDWPEIYLETARVLALIKKV